GGINNAARGIHQQATGFSHPIACYLLQTPSLCAHPRNQKKVIRREFPCLLNHLSPGCSYYVHQVIFSTPCLTSANYFLIQRLSLYIFKSLEIAATFIGGQC